MSYPRNIILTGFMGTGKTTVGRCLAEKLGWEAVDTDRLIESREGKTIPDLFAEAGEESFRTLESGTIRELIQREKTVITLGGGAVTQPENITLLSECGFFVCLRAKPETILERIQSESHRPLLEGGDRLERIRNILSDRKEIYDSIPHQINTDDKTPDEIADAIIAEWFEVET